MWGLSLANPFLSVIASKEEIDSSTGFKSTDRESQYGCTVAWLSENQAILDFKRDRNLMEAKKVKTRQA